MTPLAFAVRNHRKLLRLCIMHDAHSFIRREIGTARTEMHVLEVQNDRAALAVTWRAICRAREVK